MKLKKDINFINKYKIKSKISITRADVNSYKAFSKSAFSLIELLVSIGIITIITGIFLASYRTANKQAELTRSVSDLSSTYRLALNQSLGLSEYNGDIPEGGWGVHIDLSSDRTSYLLFADENNNGQYDDGEANKESGGRVINTPRDLEIDSIMMNDSSLIDYLDLTYIPPHPTITLETQPAIAEEINKAEITMIDKNTNKTRSVIVNFLGLIDMPN